jgi:hypothetical protein
VKTFFFLIRVSDTQDGRTNGSHLGKLTFFHARMICFIEKAVDVSITLFGKNGLSILSSE